VRPDDHCAASPTVSGHGPTNGARPCTARSSGQRCTSSPKHCGVAQLRNAAPLHSSPPPSTPGSAILPRRQACARTTTAPRRPRSVGTDQRTERTPARDGPRGGRGHPSPEHCGVAQLRSAAPLGGSHPPGTQLSHPAEATSVRPRDHCAAAPTVSGHRPTNGARPCTARSSGQRCTSSPKHCGVAQLRNTVPPDSSPPPSTPGSAILPRRQACAPAPTAPRRPRSLGTRQPIEDACPRSAARSAGGRPPLTVAELPNSAMLPRWIAACLSVPGSAILPRRQACARARRRR